MALASKVRALGLAFLMVAMALTVLSSTAKADDAPPELTVQGPWIDELVWSEEGDRSKALTEIIAGNQDTIMFDITAPADKERALASDQIGTFPAYGLFDELSMNPVERNQTANFPRNPFTIRAVREAMQYLVDRDFVVRDIYAGFATPFRTPWHPRSPDYGRAIADLLKLEDQYAFDPGKGKTQMFAALTAAGWDVGTDNFWHDPEGRLVTIKILKRIQDERLQLGGYYGNLLRGLNFNVLEIGVSNAGVPYGTEPSEERWNIYTAGWISTSITAWDDGQLQFFAACGIGEPYCVPGDPTYYDPPDALEDIANKLAFGQYQSLTERAELIANGTAMAMNESLRVFIDARQSLWVYNSRMTGMTEDLFGGHSNPWAVKTATVPVDPVTGLRTGRILNLLMFVDGWNPWVFPGWLYDSVQRRAMTDPGMANHPHTGRVINYRNTATVTTAGPTGTLSVPTDGEVFNTTTNTWTPVGAGITAVSKVSYDMIFGNWHHDVNITMDDVKYTWSNLWRRAVGDISQVSGIDNSASPSEEYFVQNVLKAIKVIDSDTIEVYMDYWHADDQEIAGFGSSFPTAPWEVQEIATKLILDQVAANHDADAGTTGRIWLDLTKGDSLNYLGEALTAYMGSNWIPPGMSADITAAEATARWAALDAWNTTYGHFWPSNGPFYLDLVDVTNRQTVMKAFRTGYPFDADYWAALRTVAIPSVSFASSPPVVFASTPAIFDYTVTVGPQPTDDVTAVWFLRDASTGEFILSNQAPDKLGTGSYRIEIPGTQTETLLLGNFEVIAVVTGNAAAVPTIQRIGFLILPSTEWFEALLDARARILEDEVDELSGTVGGLQSDLDSLSSSTSGLVGLTTAVVVLAVIAIVVSIAGILMTMRRARAPAGKAPEPPEKDEGGET